jgi:hypothetical protein
MGVAAYRLHSARRFAARTAAGHASQTMSNKAESAKSVKDVGFTTPIPDPSPLKGGREKNGTD